MVHNYDPPKVNLTQNASNGRGNGFIAVGEKLHHTKLRLYKELKSFWMSLYAEDDLFSYPNIPLCNHCVLCFLFFISLQFARVLGVKKSWVGDFAFIFLLHTPPGCGDDAGLDRFLLLQVVQ